MSSTHDDRNAHHRLVVDEDAIVARQAGDHPELSDRESSGSAGRGAVASELALLSVEVRAALRALPSVDELARQAVEDDGTRAATVAAARAVLAEARAALRRAGTPQERDMLVERVRARVRREERPHLGVVINATGVLLNTNLGRAPLSEAALAALRTVAEGYSNLEYDLEAGTRGSRQAHVRALIAELVGAEDALVVNNNAAAVLLALSALAAGREVILSRGELVEIGGGFRVPDVLRQSGARLVEVGTTNRTRVADYAAALGAETALLLSVHPSNFRVVGFTEAPPLAELAALAARHGLPLVHDLGSGCLLPTEKWGLAHEPTPRESITAGVDLVSFSGDKLLGGPQAGLLAGRRTSSSASPAIPWRARCAATSWRWRRWKRRCAITARVRRNARSPSGAPSPRHSSNCASARRAGPCGRANSAGTLTSRQIPPGSAADRCQVRVCRRWSVFCG